MHFKSCTACAMFERVSSTGTSGMPSYPIVASCLAPCCVLDCTLSRSMKVMPPTSLMIFSSPSFRPCVPFSPPPKISLPIHSLKASSNGANSSVESRYAASSSWYPCCRPTGNFFGRGSRSKARRSMPVGLTAAKSIPATRRVAASWFRETTPSTSKQRCDKKTMAERVSVQR